MSTPAVMPSHSLVQTPIFPSPLRASVSHNYSNQHHHFLNRRLMGNTGIRLNRSHRLWRVLALLNVARDPLLPIAMQ